MSTLRLNICKTCSNYYQCKNIKECGVCIDYVPKEFLSWQRELIPFWLGDCFDY